MLASYIEYHNMNFPLLVYRVDVNCPLREIIRGRERIGEGQIN